MNKVTPLDVRESIINCFYEAHCANTELGEGDVSKGYCLNIVKKIFNDCGVNFDNPTKDGVYKVVAALAEFSKNFRSQDIVEKHQKEITDLLDEMD